MIDAFLISRAPARRFGRRVPSYALSSLVAASPTGTADGSTPTAITGTVYDTNGVVMANRTITRTVARTFVSAADCTLTADASTIATTTGVLNLTLTIKNATPTVLPGRPTAAIVWSYTGTGQTFTAVSSISDRNGVYRATFSSTVAETGTISAAINGVTVAQTVAVTVGAPAAPTLVMASSFKRGGLGTAQTDVCDGTYWNSNYTNNGGAEVIAATGTDYPADANVCRHTPQIGTAGAFLAEKDGLGTIAVGDSRYYRWIWAHYWPYTGNSDADNTHPIQDGAGGIGGTSWWWGIATLVGDTQFRPQFGVQVNNGENTFNNQIWALMTPLDKATTYRFEHQIHRLTTTTFNLHVRVYDDLTNTLLYDDSDFGSYNNGYASTLSDTPTFTFRNAGSGVDGADTLSRLKFGCNGIIDSVVSTQHYADQSCFAVSDTDWIGPYVDGEADV